MVAQKQVRTYIYRIDITTMALPVESDDDEVEDGDGGQGEVQKQPALQSGASFEDFSQGGEVRGEIF